MNRLSCQESENEVALAKLRGQVRLRHCMTVGRSWAEPVAAAQRDTGCCLLNMLLLHALCVKQVEQERATSEVLAIQHEHEELSARAMGKAEAERVLAFLDTLRTSDAGKSSQAQGKDLGVELWHALRKAETLAQVRACAVRTIAERWSDQQVLVVHQKAQCCVDLRDWSIGCRWRLAQPTSTSRLRTPT